MKVNERPFGIRWGIAYALVMPSDPICGFITNPQADAIWKLQPCNSPAAYGFRFRDKDPHDIGVALGGWQGVCAEHAAVMRQRGECSEMWSL